MSSKKNKKRINSVKGNRCQDVYNVIYLADKLVTTNDIQQLLKKKYQDEKNNLEKKALFEYHKGTISGEDKELYVKSREPKLISRRTIERCIKGDERIEKKGPFYSISEKRFDSMFQGPFDFGMNTCRDVLGSYIPKNVLEYDIEQLVLRLGTCLILLFIESARPCPRKNFLIRDREDLVYYWAKKSIPSVYMFDVFLGMFQNRKRSSNRKMPFSEISYKRIKELHRVLRRLFPDLYSSFARGRSHTFGKTVRITPWELAYDTTRV